MGPMLQAIHSLNKISWSGQCALAYSGMAVNYSRKFVFRFLTTYVNTIKLFSPSFTLQQNKLECFDSILLNQVEYLTCHNLT